VFKKFLVALRAFFICEMILVALRAFFICVYFYKLTVCNVQFGTLFLNCSLSIDYALKFLSLSAFVNTDTELKLIAAAAIIGFNNGPPNI
jgi:hypothetical protein